MTEIGTKILTEKDLDEAKQPIVILPPSFAKAIANPKRAAVEFTEPAIGTLAAQVVDKKSTAQNRRYSLVFHAGSCWISVPKAWLRDRVPTAGDKIKIMQVSDTLLHLVFEKA